MTLDCRFVAKLDRHVVQPEPDKGDEPGDDARLPRAFGSVASRAIAFIEPPT